MDQPQQHQDELERALLEVQTLIDSTVAMHRDRRSQGELIEVIDGGYGAVLEAALTLMRATTTHVSIVYTGCFYARTPDIRRAERQLMLSRPTPVHLRFLSVPALLPELPVDGWAGADEESQVSVRVARMPPMQALLADGRAALVVTESAAGHRASVLQVPELVDSVRSFVDNAWRNAASPGERMIFGDRDRALLARRILGALQAGVTDEVAARELSISVRTYRRQVAEIMSMLGATSRFQAGVRAAELQLLPPTSP
ncbi:LuxR family transcriptional regulator [Streptomyces profundus]|uniref:LuxR family transcriptional regulator n=1 Tax=Streptomyces profundus TaxID=2867410 RepID=UPI001D16C3AE|nr:LuxR family transcriptional regulator [Streptomyces sp. MA3_2.13]UED85096.1 LuxR family transcriptional regulator [Streptomyces sp. MA3_2.13]